MFRLPVLMLAVLLSSTALWSAFVDGSMSIETALVRFLIAMPVAWVMLTAFNAVTRPPKPKHVRRPARASESDELTAP